jgi:rhodanese-related sulfurtransferase
VANIKRVSPAEALSLMGEGYTYVDVRTEAEYAAGHPKGAVNVPVMNAGPGGMKPNPEFLGVMESVFAKDAKIVVGCKAGGRSLRAAEMLTGAGYTDVIDQRAGWDGPRDNFGALIEPGWSPAGLPAEDATAGGSYAELKQRGAKA